MYNMKVSVLVVVLLAFLQGVGRGQKSICFKKIKNGKELDMREGTYVRVFYGLSGMSKGMFTIISDSSIRVGGDTILLSQIDNIRYIDSSDGGIGFLLVGGAGLLTSAICYSEANGNMFEQIGAGVIGVGAFFIFFTGIIIRASATYNFRNTKWAYSIKNPV
jgi:hypothetical protein